MSTNANQTDLKKGNEEEFPVAAIVCLAVGGYVMLVIIIIVIRHFLRKKGACQSTCCEISDEPCCVACSKVNEACPCCCSSNVDGCLSKVCGQRKKISCVDILLCNCCGCTEGCCEACECKSCLPSTHGCCGGETSCCVQRPGCADCWEDELENNTCKCLCLAIKVRSPRRGSSIRKSQTAASNEFQNDSNSISSSIDSVKKVEYEGKEINQKSFNVHSGSGEGMKKGSGDKIRKRSTSHSPKLYSSHSKLVPLDTSNNSTADLQHPHIKRSRSSSKEITHVSFDESLDEGTYKSIKEHKFALLSGSFSGDSTTSLFSKVPLSSSTEINSRAKTGSKLRRSLRAGQRSQRFPNKILISSESLSSSIDVRASVISATSLDKQSDISHLSSQSFSNPLNRRPLPPLNIK
ncbi:uncharacterized protein LOC131933438 [Physella acuta]|uniref:uncharacterized protein LOC131933438 n=1 Tax=Physella acuta TaxID=109671 RepID=UPI0027DD1C64|nr:uncharacterized protein LOC131933438 [Physella acuta]